MSAGSADCDNRAAMPAQRVSLSDLIQLVLVGSPAAGGSGFDLDRFLSESSPGEALLKWFGGTISESKERVARRLGRDIAWLDEAISRQVNAVLHHRRFQRLEASWRGLQYLVDQQVEDRGIKIRVLSVSWKELARDIDQAIEFDQSQLFRKVYTAEFGMPGGEPFGVLLGDYEIWPGPCAEHPVDDLKVLEGISGVAAAAFAPFVAGVHPAMFGLSDFSGFQQHVDLAPVFEQVEYLTWRAFRKKPDSRFIALTLPRVLMRLPYEDDGSRVDGFCFREDVAGPNGDIGGTASPAASGPGKYLWGNASYAFGAVLMRSFARSGWFADIRGVRRDSEGGGMATGLPVHWFSTDRSGVAAKCSTDVIVTDDREPELSDLGFIPLCHCADTEYSAFYATQSIQKPKQYNDVRATMNARISAMLQYTMCVSVFAHYVKVIVRDKIGTFTGAGQCQKYLNEWFTQYVSRDADAATEIKASRPLREAEAEVRPVPGEEGHYSCTVRLWPHFELDELASTLELKTLLKGPN